MKARSRQNVLRPTAVTPALEKTAGLLKVSEAAGMLNMSTSQVRQMCARVHDRLPHSRLIGREIVIDAAQLRKWIRDGRPMTQNDELRVEDDFDRDYAEYQARLGACHRMLARWGIEVTSGRGVDDPGAERDNEND